MPGARVRIAHGQMRGRELEAVMRDFYRQQFNVLVCTTIIENGIDIETFSRQLSHSAAKQQLGFRPDRLLVGAVGRLSKEKGFDVLWIVARIAGHRARDQSRGS